MRGAGGGVVVVRAHAALGVLELQYVAVFLAVIHDPGVFAIVLVHGVPPTFVVVVALKVFFGLRIAVYADFAVLEIYERDCVGRCLRKSNLGKHGDSECHGEWNVSKFCAHAFKIIFFEGYRLSFLIEDFIPISPYTLQLVFRAIRRSWRAR